METTESEDPGSSRAVALASTVLNFTPKLLKAFNTCGQCEELTVEFEITMPEQARVRRRLFAWAPKVEPLKVHAWRFAYKTSLPHGGKGRLYLTRAGELYLQATPKSSSQHTRQYRLDQPTLVTMPEAILEQIHKTLRSELDYLHLLKEGTRNAKKLATKDRPSSD